MTLPCANFKMLPLQQYSNGTIIEFRLKLDKCIPCSRFYDNRNKHNQREIYSESK